MSEQPKIGSEEKSAPNKIKKFRKGDLIRLDRQKYINSVEAKASDTDLPEYIFQGPGEVLSIKEDYCQVRWRRPVPDVWFKIDYLLEYK